MAQKHIFVATHPRACSTAFERVFMTCTDTLQCVHEPFGDAFYYGPERLSERYESDEEGRLKSGFSNSTFETIFERIESDNKNGKRLFIKDIIHYLFPPNGKKASIAPSLVNYKRGVGTADASHSILGGLSSTDAEPPKTNGHESHHKSGGPPYPYATDSEPGNPTVVPKALLERFHFTFLIRHPRNSIPSYFRCTVPPLDSVTGFYNFMPSEAGYDEVRRFFDFLREAGQVGPSIASRDAKPEDGKVQICVVDADDLLDSPALIIEAYCKSVGIEYTPSMLKWETDELHAAAKEAFEKWNGFHDDAINSTELKPRAHKKTPKTDDELYNEWVEKYGEEGAKVIKETVKQNLADYEYMKQFALKV